jgi:hypothetical protein
LKEKHKNYLLLTIHIRFERVADESGGILGREGEEVQKIEKRTETEEKSSFVQPFKPQITEQTLVSFILFCVQIESKRDRFFGKMFVCVCASVCASV